MQTWENSSLYFFCCVRERLEQLGAHDTANLFTKSSIYWYVYKHKRPFQTTNDAICCLEWVNNAITAACLSAIQPKCNWANTRRTRHNRPSDNLSLTAVQSNTYKKESHWRISSQVTLFQKARQKIVYETFSKLVSNTSCLRLHDVP